MQVKAKTKYLKISPKKMRYVVNAVRGMNVTEAFDYLNVMPQKAARILIKTLRSAQANASNNFSLEQDNLVIKKIVVDQGPSLKRWRARAFGRAAPILKHSSHLSVILEPRTRASTVRGRPLELAKTVASKPAPYRAKGSGAGKEKLKEPVIEPAAKEMTEGLKVEKKGKGVLKQEHDQKEKKIFDVRRKGKGRTKQHLDKVRGKKGKAGLKRIFRRKSI